MARSLFKQIFGYRLSVPFEPVNDLERLLIRAVTEPAARPDFYRALLENPLYFVRIGEPPPTTQQITLQPGETLKVNTITHEGREHTPIFSSKERVEHVARDKPVGYLAMMGRDLFTMMRGSELILNPGSEYGKVLTAAEVESMLNGSIFSGFTNPDVGGRQILLGQPSNYPHQLIDALKEKFAKLSEVNAAYLAHAQVAGVDQQPNTLIGIEMKGDWNQLLEQLGPILEANTRQGEVVSLARINPKHPDTIAKYMLNSTTAFYKRKKFMGLF